MSIVGLDVGTTSVKAVEIDEDGALVSRAAEGYPLATPQPGWAEQDPEDWWRATQRALGAIGGAPKEIGSLAATGRVDLDGLVEAHFPLEEVDQALRAGRENPTLLKVIVGCRPGRDPQPEN